MVVLRVRDMGPLCIAAGENCLLDTQDTSYQPYGPMSLDNGEICAVAGTLGTETGNATYVGFDINQISVPKGAWNVSNDNLKGTAPGTQRDTIPRSFCLLRCSNRRGRKG